MQARLSLRLAAIALAGIAGVASAEPIAISNAGYWLETVGVNTIGIAGGGAPGGVVTTVFVATTSPTAAQGTVASATINGAPTGGVVLDSPTLWARRVSNPSFDQLAPLAVTFTNDSDTATFTGRNLQGLASMPLVQGLIADGSAQQFSPHISWTLPDNAGDVDLVQVVFYNNATNLEVGNRVALPADATSLQILAALPAGFDLTVNVRLLDLADDSAGFTTGNILRASRAYVNYLVPVPEPETYALMLVGLALSGVRRFRRQ